MGQEKRCMCAQRALVDVLSGLPAWATDGSILLPHPKRQFTNSDAFFAFSAIQVRFGQVRPMTHGRAKQPSSVQAAMHCGFYLCVLQCSATVRLG